MKKFKEVSDKTVDSYFDKAVLKRLELCKEILIIKGKEYATDKDKFHNFNVAAILNGTTPEKALWGFATKHLVSIMDIIDDSDKFSGQQIEDKIGDMINYLILLGIMLQNYDK